MNVFLIISLALTFVFVVIYTRQKRLGIEAAEYIVKNQFEPASANLLTQAKNDFKGDELKRFNILVKRIETEVEELKIGHIAWLGAVVSDASLNSNEIAIPSFNKKSP